ncbi:hypothetical protein A33I_07865 [Alkalihalophilus marmarensis DSM 21297]|uniref:Uncharacterized protein n=1 Tax=Alkalihalophilus marmarensis DSM 21297 TaxID=1188261 RepID=U6STX2_9BACI|nr:hypothetical protein A33I_07865 [Alkalihalophilus marmarensis DSM 21297]
MKRLYLTLMEQGYKLHEIDQMDARYYFELNKSYKKKEKQEAYIDEIGFL